MNETITTMDALDVFLQEMTSNDRLTPRERLAIGQVRNAISDLLAELDVPYHQVELDLTGRIVDWSAENPFPPER